MARDFSKIQKIVDENRRKKMQAPSTEVPNFSQFDKNTIAEYESIPNYNVIERAFDKDKAKAYDTKQRLLDSYEKAQNREAQRFINKNNISDEMIKNAYGNHSKKDADYIASLPDANINYMLGYYDTLKDKEWEDNTREFTENHPVLSNVAAPFVKAFGSMGKTGETISNWATGTPLSNNTNTTDVLEIGRNITGTTKELIDKNAPESLKKVANTAYDVSTGVLDFGSALLLSGGNPALASAIMANNAAGSSFHDVIERGVNPNQVMATGLTNAGAEYVMNLLPFGAFDDALKSGGKNLVKNIAKQGVSEAIEEGTTEAVSTVADALINKDKSNFALAKQQYMSNGMTEEDATKQALADAAKNVGYSALIGGLSGSTIGGGTTLYNNVVGRNNVDNVSELDPLGALNATVEGEQQTIDNQSAKTESLNVAQDTDSLKSLQAFSENVVSKKMQGDKITDVVEKELLKSDYAETHTADELATMKEYLSSTNQDVIDYVNDVRKSDYDIKIEPYEIGVVNDSFANVMKDITGIDTLGYKVLLSPQAIIHIDKDHGKTGKADQTMADDETMARFEYVLNNYDSAYAGKGSGMHKQKGGKKSKTVVFEKKVDGKYYVVEALPDTDAKANYIVSMYTKKEGKSLPNVQAPGVTSMTVTTLPSNNSVTNQDENVKVPSENQRVRSYNTTLIEKTDAPQELKNEFIDNPDMYTQLSNAETLTKAVNIFDNNDISTAINEYHKLLDDKNPVAVPLGYNISKQLAKDGRLDESVQIVREMSKALTESGQFSQAAAITMLNNNPEAAKRYLVRDIDNLNREGREKFGKKWKDFELTEAELKRFSEVAEGDSEAIKGIYNDVYNRLRKEYPSTMTEKLMEYRRVAMLLNVRTNMRNVVSNALMMPVRWTADRVAALGEGVYSLIDPKYSRTQSINPIRSKKSKQLASEAFETVRSELLGDNKYEDRKGAVKDKQVFKGTAFSRAIDNMFGGALTKANEAMGKDVDPSLMETARNFTYYLLQKGDDVFVKKNFESRMASYLDAQGITDIENIPPDAYLLATQEAMKATFKDDTALSQGLTQFRQMLNKAPGGMLGDIVMPFTKTPANLAMRGIDYSPAGIYNGIKTLNNAKSEADVSKGITQLAQAATGTTAILLGMALAEAGWISGALSEDKDEAEFQKQQGQLAYSIKTPYGYFSYDWAQPASIPLILGVTLHDSFVNGKDFINGMKQGSLAAVDSWLELSPLQNMSEIFGGYGTPAENVAEVLMNDFPLSFVPSQFNAIAKTGDRTQRVSYSPDSKDSFINQAKAKIPGMSDDLPVAYDTWGNPIERQDNAGEAFFANFLNPGQFGNENVTAIDDDILALYESTGNASVFPKKAAWSYNVGGESVKLDNKQYSEFQRIMGSNAFDMADALINSNYYNGLSDEQKAETIKDMYSFADALAKGEVLGYDVEGSDTYKKTYSVYKEKGSKGVALYTSIKETLDGSTNADKVDAVNQFDISDEEKGYYLTKMITLSSAANAILESEGYAGVYRHYYQKALESKVEEMRQQPQGSVTVTQDMIDAVKRMRGQSSSNTQVTPEMIESVRKMRSGM